MNRISDFDHRTAHDAGAGSLRNLAAYYDWEIGEATALALGGGIAAVAVDRPESDRRGFLGRPPWLEVGFFEALGVDYRVSEGPDFESAWAEVTDRVEFDEPPLLFLDPHALDHVSVSVETSIHVVVAIGVSEESIVVSDPTQPEPVELSRDELERAWSVESAVSSSYRYVVTDFRTETDLETASSRAIRDTTTYVLDTMEYRRTLGGTSDLGEHGPDALRSLAADLPTWVDLDDPESAIRDLRHAVVDAGRGAGYRRLYAEGLEVVASEAGVGGGRADGMRGVADEWEVVADALGEAAAADDEDERAAALEGAASTLADVADREERFFERVRQELRT